ncbi:MAG: hypothetical protein JO020_10985 [Chloroflexi bacterium]|nr:hypothetical protein [Chloroflexota bacterium]
MPPFVPPGVETFATQGTYPESRQAMQRLASAPLVGLAIVGVAFAWVIARDERSRGQLGVPDARFDRSSSA